jgi:hypothetical protein
MVAVRSSSDAAPSSLDASQEQVESTLTDRYETTVPQAGGNQPSAATHLCAPTQASRTKPGRAL